MIAESVRVFVLPHALSRWRERFAVYGDERADDVEAAVREAVPADPLLHVPGVRRVAGSVYLWHAERRAMFVCEPVGQNCLRVVTVRCDDPKGECHHVRRVMPVARVKPSSPAAKMQSAKSVAKAQEKVVWWAWVRLRGGQWQRVTEGRRRECREAVECYQNAGYVVDVAVTPRGETPPQ